MLALARTNIFRTRNNQSLGSAFEIHVKGKINGRAVQIPRE